MRGSRWLVGVLGAALLVGLLPATTMGATATTTSLTATPTTIFPGGHTVLQATVSPDPGGGTVTFFDGSTVLGSDTVDEGGIASLSQSLSLGTHIVTARFDGFGDFTQSTSNPVTVTSALEHTTGTTTTTTLSTGAPLPAGELQPFTVVVSPAPDDGRLVFMEGNRILKVAPVDATDGVSVETIQLDPGAHSILVIYSGSATRAASVSQALTIVVPPDTVVSATGVGVSHSTVYPVVDGFGDTTLIRGNALERVSIVIEIFSQASGRRVRAQGLGTRQGPYSFAWNGRTLSGAIVAAGRYNVVQRLRDRSGNLQAFTNVVTVSLKQRVSKTGVQTRRGADYTREGTEGFGLVVPRESDGSVNVYGNVAPDWAFVTYEFTLPSAQQYRGVRFEVVGEAQPGKAGALIAMLDASGEPVVETTTGTANGRYSVSATASHVIHNRRVIATVTANGIDNAAFRVFSVRLVYTYTALE